jgi:hypothetical protein
VADRVPPIARVELARSTGRLLLLPLLLAVVGVGLAVIGVLRPLPGLIDAVAIGAIVVGAIAALIGLWVAARRMSVRLEVEEAAVHVRWLGGARIYPLSPGPVTRVRLRGDDPSKLQLRGGPLHIGVGAARLRDEEEIEVVRLAPTATGILVPTERGRLLIGAASEEALLSALSRAAQARQRLEELVASAPPAAQPPEAEPGATEAEAEPEPHVLTGIERAKLEERLAADRAAPPATPPSTPPPVAVTAPEPTRRPAGRLRRWRRQRPGSARIGRPRPSAVFVLLPLAGAGLVWGAAYLLGRLPDPASDLGRLTALGLVLAGPATSIGAIMARAWWPRLVGVVVTSGLATAVFVGRALFGA